MLEATLHFDSEGLIPAIVQDWRTGEVLMLAYMNKQSLAKTLETKTTWFYSRSRQELWNKGQTSGHVQHVKSISYDCDVDALLVKVEQVGVACHTGAPSCFFNPLLVSEEPKQDDMGTVLNSLYQVIEHRRAQPQEGSYTNYLFNKGIDKILKKVGEENAEVIIAAKNPAKSELVYETADLFYHLMVLLVEKGVPLDDIAKELASRRSSQNEKK